MQCKNFIDKDWWLFNSFAQNHSYFFNCFELVTDGFALLVYLQSKCDSSKFSWYPPPLYIQTDEAENIKLGGGGVQGQGKGCG